MKYLRAALVGLVQGLTEFLPVSSSGHLAILARFGVCPTSVFFVLSLHLATLAALLVAMRREVAELCRHPIREGRYVLLASLPTVVIAFLFKRLFPSLLTGSLLGFGFLLTSALLTLSELFRTRSVGRMLDAKVSLLTGAAQGVAVLPGVSRSGSTIAVLVACGVEGDRAARFSFLLSVPVVLGGFLLEGIESGFSAAGAETGEILVAAGMAFASGLVAARFMLGRIKKGLKPFIPYTFAIGVLCYFLP